MFMFGEWDRALLLWLNQYAGRNEVFDRAANVLVSTYLLSSMPLLACICYLWFRKAGGEAGKERRLLLSAFAGVCLAGPVSRGLQLILKFHPRPFHNPGVHFRVPAGVDPSEFNHWSSFPSDHASMYFALAFMIFLHSRRWGVLAWMLSTLAVLPRIYLGYHWPSDILAGALVGAGCVWACRKLIPQPVTSRVLRWEQNAPYVFYAMAFLVCYQVGTLFEEARRLGTDVTRAVGLHKV